MKRQWAETDASGQWGAAVLEFGTTWLLIQKDGKIYKEDLRGVYDVSAHNEDFSGHWRWERES